MWQTCPRPRPRRPVGSPPDLQLGHLRITLALQLVIRRHALASQLILVLLHAGSYLGAHGADGAAGLGGLAAGREASAAIFMNRYSAMSELAAAEAVCLVELQGPGKAVTCALSSCILRSSWYRTVSFSCNRKADARDREV